MRLRVSVEPAKAKETSANLDPEARLRSAPSTFEEQHYPITHWARLWGFSPKTVREWVRNEYGPGILCQPNTRRRSRRDYTTIMISPSAAARVYSKRTGQERLRRTQEVM